MSCKCDKNEKMPKPVDESRSDIKERQVERGEING